MRNNMWHKNTPVQITFDIADGVPSGQIWRIDDCKPIAFTGYGKLLLLIEEMSTQAHSDSALHSVPSCRGKYFCAVKVLFRQQDSIQGEMTLGIRGGISIKRLFKNALELRKFISAFAEHEYENEREKTRASVREINI